MSYVDVEFMAIYVGPKYNYISCSYECSMYIRALTSRGLQFHFWFFGHCCNYQYVGEISAEYFVFIKL
jgi:hypothetical protein